MKPTDKQLDRIQSEASEMGDIEILVAVDLVRGDEPDPWHLKYLRRQPNGIPDAERALEICKHQLDIFAERDAEEEQGVLENLADDLAQKKRLLITYVDSFPVDVVAYIDLAICAVHAELRRRSETQEKACKNSESSATKE